MTAYSSRLYTEHEASTITVGTRVILTGKDGQGTFKGFAIVTEIVPASTSNGLLVTLYTGKRTIYRRWDRLWQIRVATPID